MSKVHENKESLNHINARLPNRGAQRMSLMKLECTAKLSFDKLIYLRELRQRFQCSSVKCHTAEQIRGA
jgi:hypothetical protein